MQLAHMEFFPVLQFRIYSNIEKLFITNTIPLSEEAAACPKIIQLSIAEMLAMAIKKIHTEESLSVLFT